MTADDDPMAAFESSRRRRRQVFKVIYVAVGGAMALAVLLMTWTCVDDMRPEDPPTARASAAAVADARSAAQDALKEARAADHAFRRAIPEAIAARPVGEGGCMYRLPTRTVHASSGLSVPLFMMRTLSDGDPAPGSLLLQRVEREVASLDEDLARLHQTTEQADRAARAWADDLLDDTLEVVFVVERAHPPSVSAVGRITDGLEGPRTYDFIPGERVGRAYLWSFKFHGVVCAGDVTATNSDQLELEADGRPSPDEALSRLVLDLDIRTEMAISAGLLGLPQPQGDE